MWTYSQGTGELTHDGQPVAEGYSGLDAGHNNPLMQDVPNVGPLPQGRYAIGEPYDTDTHGPHVMRLTPADGQEMFGRAGFLIHGDNRTHTASHGCIILDRTTRNEISASGDDELEVIQ